MGAEFLSVQIQRDEPQMWFLVDPEADSEVRSFTVHGTGHPVVGDDPLFLGTFQVMGGELVFHLFERISP